MTNEQCFLATFLSEIQHIFNQPRTRFSGKIAAEGGLTFPACYTSVEKSQPEGGGKIQPRFPAKTTAESGEKLQLKTWLKNFKQC